MIRKRKIIDYLFITSASIILIIASLPLIYYGVFIITSGEEDIIEEKEITYWIVPISYSPDGNFALFEAREYEILPANIIVVYNNGNFYANSINFPLEYNLEWLSNNEFIIVNDEMEAKYQINNNGSISTIYTLEKSFEYYQTHTNNDAFVYDGRIYTYYNGTLRDHSEFVPDNINGFDYGTRYRDIVYDNDRNYTYIFGYEGYIIQYFKNNNSFRKICNVTYNTYSGFIQDNGNAIFIVLNQTFSFFDSSYDFLYFNGQSIEKIGTIFPEGYILGMDYCWNEEKGVGIIFEMYFDFMTYYDHALAYEFKKEGIKCIDFDEKMIFRPDVEYNPNTDEYYFIIGKQIYKYNFFDLRIVCTMIEWPFSLMFSNTDNSYFISTLGYNSTKGLYLIKNSYQIYDLSEPFKQSIEIMNSLTPP